MTQKIPDRPSVRELTGYEAVSYEKTAPVATITFNRPRKLNAINDPMLGEFTRAITEAENDGEAFSDGTEDCG